MAVTTLESSLAPLTMSSDGGSTYQSVVCRKTWTFNGETPISEEPTDCGNYIAPGVPKWGFDTEGVLSTTPGSGEISAEGMLSLWLNKTSILVKLQYPTSGSPGTDLYLQGAAYITNFKVTGSSGSLITFSATITGNGTLDIDRKSVV